MQLQALLPPSSPVNRCNSNNYLCAAMRQRLALYSNSSNRVCNSVLAAAATHQAGSVGGRHPDQPRVAGNRDRNNFVLHSLALNSLWAGLHASLLISVLNVLWSLQSAAVTLLVKDQVVMESCLHNFREAMYALIGYPGIRRRLGAPCWEPIVA